MRGRNGTGSGSLFVDQASPGVERIFRYFQLMPFPCVIYRLLEHLFDRLPLDLEIAVETGFAETQYLHDVLSLPGGSSRLQRPPIYGIAAFYSKGLATRGQRAGVTCIRLIPGVCRHSRFRVSPEGVTKMSHRGCCGGFIAKVNLSGKPGIRGFPAATRMSLATR
jgi:hypothetical protein